MYMICNFQLVQVNDALFLNSFNKGIKISSAPLAKILTLLKERKPLEISETELTQLADTCGVDPQALINTLMNKLSLIRPVTARKFQTIYINSDDAIIADFLQDAFNKEYRVELVASDFIEYHAKSLVIFYRANYSHNDFKILYQKLPNDVCIVTAGIVHKILIIDNLYYRGSGLPTHFSNFNNLLAGIHSNLSITKNNWLLFYRSLMQGRSEKFPDPDINLCQKGFITHSLFQFASQFTDFWNIPMTLDNINWFWHVDLTGLNVFKEIAIHSPYSQYDMNLNLAVHEMPHELKATTGANMEQEYGCAE